MIGAKDITAKVMTNWKSKLAYTLLSIFVVFLMKFWLDSYEKSNSALTDSLDKNTIAIGSLGRTMDSLRYSTGDFIDKILDKIGDNKEDLKDHETRLRELERNR